MSNATGDHIKLPLLEVISFSLRREIVDLPNKDPSIFAKGPPLDYAIGDVKEYMVVRLEGRLWKIDTPRGFLESLTKLALKNEEKSDV